MDKKVTGIVSYLWWVGWIISYCAGDKEGAKFHLNQSLVLNIGYTAVWLIPIFLGFIPVIGFIIKLACWLLDIALFVLWIIGLIAAIKDEEKAIPILGGIKILK